MKGTQFTALLFFHPFFHYAESICLFSIPLLLLLLLLLLLFNLLLFIFFALELSVR